MALQLKEVLFERSFNLISLKGMSLASSKHTFNEGKWPDSYLKIDRKIWLHKLSSDKLIQLAKIWLPRSLVKMQVLSDQESIKFSVCCKETAGKVSMCCFDIQHSNIKQLLKGVSQQRKKNQTWKERMELRFREPGRENSVQLSEQKDWRRRGWAEVCWWLRSENCWTFDWVWVYLTWKVKVGSGLFNSNQMIKRHLFLTEQQWSPPLKLELAWQHPVNQGTSCFIPQELTSKRIILFQTLSACYLFQSWKLLQSK